MEQMKQEIYKYETPGDMRNDFYYNENLKSVSCISHFENNDE